ncbi:MAG TPA: TIGR00296 family protein, partial [Nitrososphaera sp.]|nr:TIGR00296 family protein [Nitrososphaera sp.]
MMPESEGERAVHLARKAVLEYLTSGVIIKSHEARIPRRGVFVTLNRLNASGNEDLRGCIGFPLPSMDFSDSVIQAAVAAATEDPRFSPVQLHELDKTTFEVSILTEPVEIPHNPSEAARHILLGRDGLILRWRNQSGLLLPQVATEMGWSTADLLENILYKTGAPAEAWR